MDLKAIISHSRLAGGHYWIPNYGVTIAAELISLTQWIYIKIHGKSTQTRAHWRYKYIYITGECEAVTRSKRKSARRKFCIQNSLDNWVSVLFSFAFALLIQLELLKRLNTSSDMFDGLFYSVLLALLRSLYISFQQFARCFANCINVHHLLRVAYYYTTSSIR